MNNSEQLTVFKAKMIGSKFGLIGSGAGVLIAQFIMIEMYSSERSFVHAFFWFMSVSYKLNLLIGVIILLLCGHFYGQIAGRLILIKNYNYILVGVLTGIIVVLTTAFFCGWTGFFQEGNRSIGAQENPFWDYILKPFFWVTLFGISPSIFVGLMLGFLLKLVAVKHKRL